MRGLIGGFDPNAGEGRHKSAREQGDLQTKSDPTKKCRKRLLYYGTPRRRDTDNLISPRVEGPEGVSTLGLIP